MALKKLILDEDGDTLEVSLNQEDEVMISLSYRDAQFCFECKEDIEELIRQLKEYL